MLKGIDNKIGQYDYILLLVETDLSDSIIQFISQAYMPLFSLYKKSSAVSFNHSFSK